MPIKHQQSQAGWVLPIVLVIIVAAFAIPKYLSYAEQSAQPEQPRQRPPTAVRVIELVAEPLTDALVVNGSLSGAESITLKSEIVGRVAEVAFQEGSEVTAGQVLIRLDDSELRAEQASLQTELDLAQESYQRRQKLFGQNLVSAEDYESALSSRKVLEARLKLLDARLAKATLRAPFSGVIGLRAVSPGELVAQNTAIANLEIVSELKLTFGLPEIYQTRLRKDLQVEIAVAGIEDRFNGQVYAWDPRIDAASRTIQVRATVANPDRLILPGNFATVTLALQTIDDALLIPATALVRDLNKNTVFTVVDGKAAAQTVDVGVRTRDKVQVTAGLKPGDQVIYLGVQALRNGQPVRVSEPQPQPVLSDAS